MGCRHCRIGKDGQKASFSEMIYYIKDLLSLRGIVMLSAWRYLHQAMKRQRSWYCLDLPPPPLLLSSLHPQSALAFLCALHFSCATDFSLSAQTDLYAAINCLLLWRGLLWMKQPGLTAGWTAIWSFIAGLSSLENFSAHLRSSATTSHPQCYVFPNLSASLTLRACFWAPPCLWVEILTRQSSLAVTSGQGVETGGNPMRWGRKERALQRTKPGCCRTAGW